MVAVITGDIVNSTTRKRPDSLVFSEIDHILTSVFEVMEQKGWLGAGDFVTFRGDSFQCILPAALGLTAALMIKAALKGGVDIHAPQVTEPWSCRLVIGVGEVTHRASDISKSNGPVFQISGRTLDAMPRDHFLEVKTPWQEANDEFELLCRFLDIIIERLWTVNSGRTVWMYFREGSTQQELADLFGISQPAMNQRIQGAELSVLEQTIRRYQNILQNLLP